ncbi:MAG TPA: hypothetical protein PLO20_12335, partial [Thermogutta sp.]|nr:hypothetical protein [Thermogutta sp.]
PPWLPQKVQAGTGAAIRVGAFWRVRRSQIRAGTGACPYEGWFFHIRERRTAHRRVILSFLARGGLA